MKIINNCPSCEEPMRFTDCQVEKYKNTPFVVEFFVCDKCGDCYEITTNQNIKDSELQEVIQYLINDHGQN